MSYFIKPGTFAKGGVWYHDSMAKALGRLYVVAYYAQHGGPPSQWQAAIDDINDAILRVKATDNPESLGAFGIHLPDGNIWIAGECNESHQ